MNRDLLPSREELLTATRATFKLGSKQSPTAEQLKYTMTLLVPSLYALEHHSVKGGKQPVTFSIPNYNEADRRSHRPWQVDIINDQSPDKVIMKSRQLGLSEVGIMELMWFVDRYSEQGVKALYTFPRLWGVVG